MKRTILCLAVMAILIELGMAANYTVGGPKGWDNSNNGLKTWASSRSFFVGDNLIFQYNQMHDVIEVTKTDYDSCQPNNVIQLYNDGNTVIPLSSPGKRYFICGTSGHCLQGMKVEIDTLATRTTSSPPAASPSLAPKGPPPTPTPAGSPEAAAPTSSSPLSPDTGSSSDIPSSASPNIAPSTKTHEPAPAAAPSAASINYAKGGFQASLLTGFSAIVMLLAFLALI